MKLDINEEERDFLEGALEQIKFTLDFDDSIEYGPTINDLLEKLTKLK
jgi:hypothetical protein